MGAENRVTAFDQCLHRRDLAVTGCRPPSTIAGRALRLAYLTLARVLRWLALLAGRPKTSRSWCSGTRVATSPRQSTPRAVVDRPSLSQRAEQAAAHPAASAAACLARGPCCAGHAELVARRWNYSPRREGRPPSPQPIRPCCCGWPARVPAGATDAFTVSWSASATGWSPPPSGDLEERRHRSRPAAVRPDLATVPHCRTPALRRDRSAPAMRSPRRPPTRVHAGHM